MDGKERRATRAWNAYGGTHTVEDRMGAGMSDAMRDVTTLLKAMRGGDQHAANELLPLVYQELHRLAAGYMRRERKDHTLQATALVNEAYLKLAKGSVDWQNREHFIGVAANVMRRVLVDYARAHNAEFRGGGQHKVELEDGLAVSMENAETMLQVDEALNRLAVKSPRQAQVVEMRYFGGLGLEEIAAVLDVAERTVKRDWQAARLWLYEELKPLAKESRQATE